MANKIITELISKPHQIVSLNKGNSTAHTNDNE